MGRILLSVTLIILMSTVAFAREFEVTGIIHQEKPSAIVNGKIVGIGDEIDGAVVTEILDNSVFLKFEGDIIIKNVSGKKIPDVKAKNTRQVDSTGSNPVSSIDYLTWMAITVVVAGAAFYFSGRNSKDADDNNVNFSG